jgi:hypothetical protein
MIGENYIEKILTTGEKRSGNTLLSRSKARKTACFLFVAKRSNAQRIRRKALTRGLE